MRPALERDLHMCERERVDHYKVWLLAFVVPLHNCVLSRMLRARLVIGLEKKDLKATQPSPSVPPLTLEHKIRKHDNPRVKPPQIYWQPTVGPKSVSPESYNLAVWQFSPR